MSSLNTSPNIPCVDDIYEMLLGLCDPDPEVSLRNQSRLILLLVNHIGDHQIIAEAVRQARG